MSEALSSYAGVHGEVYSMLEDLIHELSTSGALPAEEALKRAKQMQSRLSKSNWEHSDSSALPLLSVRRFADAASGTESCKTPATVLDVCLDKRNHINMEHVGQLESKLAKLFGELVQLQSSLQTTPISPPFLLQPMREHCCDHVTSCCRMISDCCHDLLCLSLLAPTTPWQSAVTPLHPKLSANGIMKSMPPTIRTRKEVRDAVERACNYFLYLHDMDQMKCNSLAEELHFHKSVYSLQVSYVTSLIDAIKSGYEKFESSIQDVICKPLQDILTGFDACNLDSTTSNVAFLQLLEEHKEELTGALKTFKEHPQGTAALSEFGENFLKSLVTLENDCSKKRSNALATMNLKK